MPDIEDIAKHVALTIGTDQFGVPRSQLTPWNTGNRPIPLLNQFWNPVRNKMAAMADTPLHWPLVVGFAIRKLIVLNKSAADPSTAAQIAIEIATAMAKIDPAKIYRA